MAGQSDPLEQPPYLDISRYLDIWHLDTGYLNISISMYLLPLYSHLMGLVAITLSGAIKRPACLASMDGGRDLQQQTESGTDV